MVAERKMQPPGLKDVVKGRVGACGSKIRNVVAGARLHLLLAVCPRAGHLSSLCSVSSSVKRWYWQCLPHTFVVRMK